MNTNIDSGLQLLACKYIRRQVDRLVRHLDGARESKDVEDIHQVRVACRRMRAAMNLFADCFDDELVEGWKRQTRKLLKSFGLARDLDVQILFLESQLENLTPEQNGMAPGIRRILSCWREKRQAVQKQVIKAVKSAQQNHIFDEIQHQMEARLVELKPLRASVKSLSVRRRACGRIHQRILEMLEKFPAIENPIAITEHHQIRIAAKKMRYAMEICNEALNDKKLKKAIKRVKKMQTILGEMHDCDVWNVDIDGFMEQERQHTIDVYGSARTFNFVIKGLEYIRNERHARRVELFGLAREMIHELARKNYWQKLLRYLQPPTDDFEGDNRGDQPKKQ